MCKKSYNIYKILGNDITKTTLSGMFNDRQRSVCLAVVVFNSKNLCGNNRIVFTYTGKCC